MFRVLIFLVTVSLLALSVTISMLNPLDLEIDLYFHKYTAPLPLFLFISFLMGSFLALLFFLSAYIKHKHEAMKIDHAFLHCDGAKIEAITEQDNREGG